MKHLNLFKFILISFFILFSPGNVKAEIGGLTKCSDSAAFNKRLKVSVKKLEQRISKYEKGSPSG